MKNNNQLDWEKKFDNFVDEDLFDLHIRGCKIADDLTNKGCEHNKQIFKAEIKDFISSLLKQQRKTLCKEIEGMKKEHTGGHCAKGKCNCSWGKYNQAIKDILGKIKK